MTSVQATAEVFLTALAGLPREERRAVLLRLIQDQRLRHDLLDLAVIAERRKEPTRKLRQYLAAKRRQG